MTTSELQIQPKCPDCGRLTVDNPQHCPEKSPAAWATSCQWHVCTGTVARGDGKQVKCGRVYGPVGWPGYGGAA